MPTVLRVFVQRRWPPLLAACSTIGYGVAVLGFGLDFRPLHNDEGVTLGVASQPSIADVLHTAIDVRHGPPLHYVLVHLSLLWRDDILGLRTPSALLGIVAVAVSFGAGRELIGRAGGAVVSVCVATSPVVIHLGQFARGYTAMIAAAFASLWVMLVLVRTRRLRWVPVYALTALLLVAAHPFGLFALGSELALVVGFSVAPRFRGTRLDRRTLMVPGLALLLGAAALIGLRQVYAPLQDKYRVGEGGPVVDLGSSAFWHRLGGHVTGSTIPALELLLAVAVLAGIGVLLATNRRAAVVVVVWLALPIGALQLLTAASSDFAPERHLSFLLPGYTVAFAALVVEIGRRLRGTRSAVVAALLAAGLLAPAVVADVNDLGNFDSSLRDASLALASRFTTSDVLLTTAGKSEPGEDPREYGAYAALAAPDESPLALWQGTDRPLRCTLVTQVEQRPAPDRVWMLVRPTDPRVLAAALLRAGAVTADAYGSFVLASAPVPQLTPQNALYVGAHLWAAAVEAQPDVHDFRRMARLYRTALLLDKLGRCR